VSLDFAIKQLDAEIEALQHKLVADKSSSLSSTFCRHRALCLGRTALRAAKADGAVTPDQVNEVYKRFRTEGL
jgi:hypothetical protein